jgi:DtxR family Mn-dependent transcriptional regulator
MPKELTSQAEEYLEAIFKLEQGEAGASTSGIAEELGIAQATVSGMLHRLREKGLLDYEPYGSISLTEEGRKEAAAVIRRHRLSERLLTDILGLPWDTAHQQACLLEHAITEEIAQAIETKLGEVRTCPHGNPVDVTAADESVPLDSLDPGQCGVVAKVTDETPEMLNYLATLGLYPGVHVCVEEKAPFNGPLMVRIKDAVYALGALVCDKIWVHIAGRRHPRGHPPGKGRGLGRRLRGRGLGRRRQ